MTTPLISIVKLAVLSTDLGPKLSGHPLFAEVEEHLGKLQGLLTSEEVIDQAGGDR